MIQFFKIFSIFYRNKAALNNVSGPKLTKLFPINETGSFIELHRYLKLVAPRVA